MEDKSCSVLLSFVKKFINREIKTVYLSFNFQTLTHLSTFEFFASSPFIYIYILLSYEFAKDRRGREANSNF